MNWEAIGAIGEILGAGVVVVTLGYLAIQVKHAKASAADANRLARAHGVTEMQLMMIDNPHTMLTWMRGNGNAEYYQELATKFELSNEEAVTSDSICLYWFWLHWGQYSSQNSPEDLEELSTTVGKFYQLPIMQHSWYHSPFASSLLEDGFVEFVERSVARETT